MQLLDLPEEILDFILGLAIPPLNPRESFPESQSLLTCRTLHRIGLPILYRILLLQSSNAECVRRTLLERPTLIRHVRHLYSTATTLWLHLVLRAIGRAKGSLQTLDFFIRIPWMSGRLNGDSDEGEPLAAVPVRRLTVRQGSPMVMRDQVSAVANALAEAVERWPNLEIVEIQPRILLSSMSQGQSSPLALALSRSPSLRLLRTALPPAWDPSLLAVSENPSLRRIVFTKPRLTSGSAGVTAKDVDVLATTLVAQKDLLPWLVEAQKHHRLMELIIAT